jgi:hypothetical protein
MNIDVVLALMSITMVAPAMIALLYLVFSGRFGGTEDARSLPLRDFEEDVWQHEVREKTAERAR